MSQLTISETAFKAATTSMHIIAIASTVFRLGYRYKTRRHWWDDYWAALDVIFDLGFFTSIWLRVSNGQPATLNTTEAKVVRYWMSSLFYPCVVWAARISIGLSILRIVPPGTRSRRIISLLIGLFSLIWLGLLLQKIITCTKSTAWHNSKTTQCFLGRGVGIFTLSTDVFADACLIVIPLRLLRQVRLPKPERRLLTTIFGASILSTLASIVYATFVFKADTFNLQMRGGLVGVTSHAKATITLMVSNLLVIVPYIYRLFKKDEEDWGLNVTFDAAVSQTKTYVAPDNLDKNTEEGTKWTTHIPFATLTKSRKNGSENSSVKDEKVVI